MAQVILNEIEIVQGTSVEVDFSLFDSDGAVINMTDANKTLALSFKGTRDIKATTFTRLSTTSAHVTWRSQADGRGTWTFLASESFTAGTYIVGVFFTDSADTLTPRWIGDTVYTIVAPATAVV